MRDRLRGRIVALLGIAIVSLGMRSATTAFAPLFQRVDAELGLGPLVLGVIGSLPPFAFAAAGFVTPWLSRRFGIDASIVIATAMIAGGQIVRSLGTEAGLIIASTAVATIGIGIGNVLLPVIVKRYFPERIGVLTAVYAVFFSLSGTSPAFVSVPLADAVGWRMALASWAITSLLALVPWIILAAGGRGADPVAVPSATDVPVRVSRAPLAWALALVLFSSGLVSHGAAAWLPLILGQYAGMDEASAATHFGIALAVGIPSAVLVPLIAVRTIPATIVVALAGLLGCGGWIGLLVAPQSVPALWTFMLGCGTLSFALVLVQVAVRAASPRVAVRLSAFVQTFAYVGAGLTVLGLGLLHDLTSGWVAPLVVFAVLAALPLAVLPIMAKPGLVDDPRDAAEEERDLAAEPDATPDRLVR